MSVSAAYSLEFPPAFTPTPPNFTSIFNTTLEDYKHKTKNDLASHPLLPNFQSCDSPEAILAVFREQIPAYSRFEDGDDRLTKWVPPTVNVLYSFSTAHGGDVGLAFSPANIIFAGIGVLFQATEDVSSRDKLIDLSIRIEHIFHLLEAYTGIIPTVGIADVIVGIMAEVLSILAIATKEARSGRLNKYFKKYIGNADIENGLRRLEILTQKEAQMASAELLKGVEAR